MKVIYDPSNFYLVHMDRKNEPAMRRDLENFIEDWDNVRYEGSVYLNTVIYPSIVVYLHIDKTPVAAHALGICNVRASMATTAVYGM